MNVAVLVTLAPFIYGGAEKMADDLVFHLKKNGHKAKRYDTLWYGGRLRHFALSVLSSDMLRFDDVDLVIPIVPVNVGISHYNVVPWLLGQPKAIYDFFDTDVGFGQHGGEGRVIRNIVINGDTDALKSMRRVYTISPRVKELLKEYNGIDSEVLILPIELDGGFHCKEYGEYVMYHSRLLPQKRQHLAIEAMRYTKTPVRLLIAGEDNDTDYVKSMHDFVNTHSLSDKVDLVVGRFSDEQKIEWLASCLGGFYLGEDEDYWAIVTTEVMLSKKPVIAPLDTGATKYVVQDGITGFQPENSPEAIAEAMDGLYRDKEAAQRMGESADELIRSISPTWETVVRTLTGEENLF